MSRRWTLVVFANICVVLGEHHGQFMSNTSILYSCCSTYWVSFTQSKSEYNMATWYCVYCLVWLLHSFWTHLRSPNLQLSASVAADAVKSFLLAAITMVTGFSVLYTKTGGGFNKLLLQLTRSKTMAAKCVNFFFQIQKWQTLCMILVWKIYCDSFHHWDILVNNNHGQNQNYLTLMYGLFWAVQHSTVERFWSTISLPQP